MCCGRSRRHRAVRCSWSKPQRMLACRTQRVMSSRLSSVKPKRARTGAACARLSTSLAVTLLPARPSSCVATPSSGLVWTSERSASRIRSRCAGCAPCRTSPSPKSALISGAYVSMSGHITRMSRGSSVGSSASRPSSTSRSTSTWRAGPWQACTCTERSDCRQRPALWPNGIRGDVGLQPAEQRVRAGGRRAEVLVGGDVGGQAALQLAQVPAEGGQQRMADRAVTGVVAARNRAAHAGERSPQVVAGVRQPQVKIVVGGQRPDQLDLGGRQPGVPEQRQPLRQVSRLNHEGGQRFSACRTWGGSAGTGSARARHSGGCQSRSLGRPPLPPSSQSIEQLRALPGVRREQARDAPRHGVAPPQPQLLLGLARLEVTEVGGQRAAPAARRDWRR